MPAFPDAAFLAAQRRLVALRPKKSMTVVGKEDHEGVLGQAESLDGANDLADALVHLRHHLHVGFLFGEPRRVRRLALIRAPFDPAPRSLEWRMHGFVRHVEAKRPVPILFDELHRVARDEMSGIACFLHLLQALPPVVGAHPVVVRYVVDVAAYKSAEAVESMMNGVVFFVIAQVPLAEDARRVSGLLQDFGKRDLTVLKSDVIHGVGRIGRDHGGDSGPLLVAPGQEPRAGRAADDAA